MYHTYTHSHTCAHKSIYKYIFISPSFLVYVSYTPIFSLYVLTVLDMNGKGVFVWLRHRSLVGRAKFRLLMSVAAGLFGCEGLFQTHCEWRRFLSVHVMPVATMARFSSVILSHMSSVWVCVCTHVCISCVCVCERARMQVCGHLCVGGVNVCVCVCVLNQYSNLACCLNWMLKDFGEDFINVNYVSMYSMYVCNVCKTNQWKKKNGEEKECCFWFVLRPEISWE